MAVFAQAPCVTRIFGFKILNSPGKYSLQL